MSGEGVGVLLGDQRKGIITMCIPIAVALLVQQLNNIVDSLWVSDLGGDSMAALGVVYPMYCVLIGIGNGLGIGVASAIARNIGKKDKVNADGVAMQGLVLTAVVSVPIGLALFLTAGITTDLMGAGGMRDECLGYAIPIYISSFFIILSGVVSGMLRGEGAAKRSMVIQVVGAVINIILDPIMIFGMDMGVAGAAWATVISFVISSFMGLYWYLRGSTYISLHRVDIRPDMARLREILSVGLPEALELSLMNVFNIALNYYVIFCGGTDAVAIYSTAWRIAYILMIPGQAVGGAIVSICSAEYGMRRFDMIRDAFRYSVIVSVASLIALCACMAVLAGPIASVFTHSPDMQYLGYEMTVLLYFFALFMPLMSLVFTGSSLMQAIQHANGAMLNSLARNILLVALFAAAAYGFGTTTSVWCALAIGEVIGGLMMGIHAVICLRRESMGSGISVSSSP